MKIDFNALADFAICHFDSSELYEDDAWSIEFEGQKVYCERKRTHFALHVGEQVHKLPRF